MLIINSKMHCWHFNIYEQNKFHAQLSTRLLIIYCSHACSIHASIGNNNTGADQTARVRRIVYQAAKSEFDSVVHTSPSVNFR